MMFVTMLFSVLSLSAFASDGAGSDTSNNGALEFIKQPRMPSKPDNGPFENPDVDYRKQAMNYFTRNGRGKPEVLRCSQYQSRSPYAFNAKCGLGYTAVQLYVRSTDVRHCYVGASCVVSDSGSNH